MLTRELAVNVLDGSLVVPDRLRRGPHARYEQIAEAMLRVYREGLGKTRQELQEAATRLFDEVPDCPPRRIEAFCKLLEDPPGAKFDTDSRGKGAVLRQKVFRAAARRHPLVTRRDNLFESEEGAVKAAVAAELGYATWLELEPWLFADVFENNRLLAFDGFECGRDLLSRYNVAQVQVALFDATRVAIRATQDFKAIVRQAKLARLLLTITAPPDDAPNGAYLIELDGPASVLVETHRYGVAMAKFLPSLLACAGWQLRADIRRPEGRRTYRLELSPRDGLNSHVLPPTEFDSLFEETFASKWGTEKRQGWAMKREGDILRRGQTVVIPDFSFHHDDGRRAYLEIAAYWTPEYVETKSRKLGLFPNEPLILAMPNKVAKDWPDMPSNVLLYKSALKINAVLNALERVGREIRPERGVR